MNKKEWLGLIAEQMDSSLVDAEKIVSAVFDTIKVAMASKDSIAIPGFGTFSIKLRQARAGRNPSTGETIQIAEATMPVFKAATALKEQLKEK